LRNFSDYGEEMRARYEIDDFEISMEKIYNDVSICGILSTVEASNLDLIKHWTLISERLSVIKTRLTGKKSYEIKSSKQIINLETLF
jgi:hypothetical protein